MKNTITFEKDKVVLHNFEGIKNSISLRIYPTNNFNLSASFAPSDCVTHTYTIDEQGCIDNVSLFRFLKKVGQGNPLTFVRLNDGFYLLGYKPTPLQIQNFLKEA